MTADRSAIIRSIRAFELMLERLDGDRVPDASAWAGSAAYWACAVDEQLEKLPGYTSRRNTTAGRVLLGIRLARNALAHGALAATQPAGLEYSLSDPLDYGPEVWAPCQVLLDSLDREPSETKKASYIELVEGRRLEEPLRVALAWLQGERLREWPGV